jgi:hypothetical protein
MLAIAGILEGFFSPSSAPVWLKFVAAFLLFTLLVLWLWSAPGDEVVDSSLSETGSASHLAYKSALSLISR